MLDINEKDLPVVEFLLYEQQYLELLEKGETQMALICLRTVLAQRSVNTQKLHNLASLIMCKKPEDLRNKANWDGSGVESRKRLLDKV
jgi:WD40 repeat protein